MFPSALGELRQHEDVVDRRTGNRIDALPLQLVDARNEPRHMLLLAGRREGARDREQRNLLAGEDLARRTLCGALGRHYHEARIGKPVSDLDRHLVPSLFCTVRNLNAQP